MDPAARLIELSKPPSEKEAFERWLEMRDALDFLRSNARENEFIVYASTESMFLHAVLVQSDSVNPPNTEDLMQWGYNPHSSWGISVSFTHGEADSISIVPPLDNTGSKTLDQGEQLIFARDFEGRVGSKAYYEVLQKFTHVFELHFLESRNAYCRLDKHGDIEDVIRIVEPFTRGTAYGGTVITFNRDVLDEYLVLTGSTIVRMFDVTRYRPFHFGGWSDDQDVRYSTEPDLFYRSHIEAGHASYMRGCEIVHSRTSKEVVRKRHDFGKHEDRQYASFIALDWKNGVVCEISCAPGLTANYFQPESNLPFETSPVFFRPEVLSKYKADSEKYRLEDRSISCRGAWHLQTYDINEAGQVHTYIVYLRNLPYEEQLCWRAYNEEPRGGISKRALETDFRGSWDLSYDPLISLKASLSEWNRRQVPWWTLRDEKLPDLVHYPVTSSHDEWGNEILHLDQFVVEGFETRWLRTKAEQLGRTPDGSAQSLGLLEQCLIGFGFGEEAGRGIITPLRQAHYLRTKLKGHASGEQAVGARKKALADHGSYKNHFRALTEAIHQAIRVIETTFSKP